MSFLDDVKGLVGTVAPTLATALGGPLAGMATRQIAGALLGQEDASLEEIERRVAMAGPGDLVKLKEVEADFKVKLKEAGVELAAIDARDRDSARRRQVAMGDWTPTILGVLIILGFFGILGVMFFIEVPPAAQALVNVLFGALTGMCVQVGNYFFGSSAGSAKKNDMIADLKAAKI